MSCGDGRGGGQGEATVPTVHLCGFRVGRTARAGRTGQAFTLLLKVQVRLRVWDPGRLLPQRARGWLRPSHEAPFFQERRFLRMLAEAGAPELARHEIPRELLQPLVPRYEEALSQLEKTVKVRSAGPGCGPASWPCSRVARCGGEPGRQGQTRATSPCPLRLPGGWECSRQAPFSPLTGRAETEGGLGCWELLCSPLLDSV